MGAEIEYIVERRTVQRTRVSDLSCWGAAEKARDEDRWPSIGEVQIVAYPAHLEYASEADRILETLVLP